VYIYINIKNYAHTYIYINMGTRQALDQVFKYIYIYVYKNINIYIYIYMDISMYIRIYIQIWVHVKL
jgi:hypothetical protein